MNKDKYCTDCGGLLAEHQPIELCVERKLLDHLAEMLAPLREDRRAPKRFQTIEHVAYAYRRACGLHETLDVCEDSGDPIEPHQWRVCSDGKVRTYEQAIRHGHGAQKMAKLGTPPWSPEFQIDAAHNAEIALDSIDKAYLELAGLVGPVSWVYADALLEAAADRIALLRRMIGPLVEEAHYHQGYGSPPPREPDTCGNCRHFSRYVSVDGSTVEGRCARHDHTIRVESDTCEKHESDPGDVPF